MALSLTPSASAAEVPADPTNYRDLLGTLVPGDTMVLAPGTYTRLTLQNLHGTADAPITITGPEAGDPAIILGEGGSNTVQFYVASYVTVRNLTVDLQGLPVDGFNAKDGATHHIVIENNVIRGFPSPEQFDIAQQIVGISNKDIAWNWTIRGNTILEPGTGMYLGNSDGGAPFIAGVIENNLVLNPLGYALQVKQQNDYQPPEGAPSGPNVTIIRNNVLIKDDRASPDGDRPTLLVGGFPDAGPGSSDTYQIYGNLLFYNPREALFQATGRFSVHDNIFIGGSPDFAALTATGHQGKSVKLGYVYNNTFFTSGRGVRFSEAASEGDAVVGNLVFAGEGISGSITDNRDNLTFTQAEAVGIVNQPVAALGTADFYPLPGTVEGTAMDMTKFATDVDYDRDYNGTPKGTFTFRGAYAGAGTNPGCPLAAEIKACGSDSDTSGGDGTDADGGDDVGTSDASGVGEGANADSGAPQPGTGQGSDATGGAPASDGDDPSGCGCRTTGVGAAGAWWLFAMIAMSRRGR